MSEPREQYRIIVAVGSNLSPLEKIPRGLQLAREVFPDLRAATFYRTRPLRDRPQPAYVNGVFAATTALSPEAIVDHLHRIEAACGRTRDPHDSYASRSLDLDLVFYEGLADPTRRLPAAELTARDFVLIPAAELCPDLLVPGTERTLGDLAAAFTPDSTMEPVTLSASSRSPATGVGALAGLAALSALGLLFPAARGEPLPLLAAVVPLARLGSSAARILGSVLTIATLAYLGLVLYMFLNQHRYIYFPTADWDATPPAVGLSYQEIEIPVGKNDLLSAWYIPAPDPDQPETCILFCHGNGGNISHRLTTLKTFHELGYSCLIIDYRGYGKSTGRPSEQNTYDDATAAWEHLTQARGLPPQSIIVFGRSLGGAVAAELAARKCPALLVLEASFTSIVDVGRHHYPHLPVRLLSRYRYPTVDHLRKVSCPILVTHSRSDETVPYALGKALYDAAPEPKAFLELNGGHNTFQDAMGNDYASRLNGAMRALISPPDSE